MDDIVYDVPIGEVAKLLDRSDRQVRRYVKANGLKARPVRVDGHVKLMFNRDEIAEFSERLRRGGAFKGSEREIVVDARLIEGRDEKLEQERVISAAERTESAEPGAVRYVMDALREHIRELQSENRELHYQLEQRSGQVGFLQGKVESLESEVKMLAPAPKSQEEIVKQKPWYRRIFGGGQ